MSDKNKDLLIPRYEQIANYPDNTRNVGDIIEIDTKKSQEWIDSHCAFFDKYPHLFRRLQWWERRSIEELPEYVRHNRTGVVFKVVKWEQATYSANCNPIIEEDVSAGGYLTNVLYDSLMPMFIPATESDYLTYQKQKDGK